MIRKYQRLFNMFLVLIDAAMLTFAYLLASRRGLAANESGFLGMGFSPDFLWVIPLVLSSFYLLDIYTPMRSKNFPFEALLICRAFAVGLAAAAFALLILDDLDRCRQFLPAFGILGICLILYVRYLIRMTLRHFRGRGYNLKHLLIVGAGPVGAQFAGRVLANREYGYNIIGFLDDDPRKQGARVSGLPVMGRIHTLGGLLAGKYVDEVIIALPLRAYDRYEEIVTACEKEGIRVRIIPDFHGFVTVNPRIDDLDGIPLINVRSIPLDDPLKRFTKRGFDIVFSLIAILVSSPLMLAVAIGVKLSSPGPVLFRQERIGLNNRPFRMLKFRSMRIMDEETAATRWTTADDPRRTGFGTFIRKTSLDELPQFFNVLAGEMSIVGPRPERPYFVEQFKNRIPNYMVKHQVKPGITGWAQVNGWRGDTSIEKRIECDLYYIENWALTLDMRIMLATLFRGFAGRNAY